MRSAKFFFVFSVILFGSPLSCTSVEENNTPSKKHIESKNANCENQHPFDLSEECIDKYTSSWKGYLAKNKIVLVGVLLNGQLFDGIAIDTKTKKMVRSGPHGLSQFKKVYLSKSSNKSRIHIEKIKDIEVDDIVFNRIESNITSRLDLILSSNNSIINTLVREPNNEERQFFLSSFKKFSENYANQDSIPEIYTLTDINSNGNWEYWYRWGNEAYRFSYRIKELVSKNKEWKEL